MARYYNATRGPIAVSLSSGQSVSVPPKRWIDIDPADEGSPNLVPLVRKKYLVRSALDSVAATPVAAAASVEAPASIPEPKLVSVPVPAPTASAGGAPMMGAPKKK